MTEERTPITKLAVAMKNAGMSAYAMARAMSWNPSAGYANQISRGDIAIGESTADDIASVLDIPRHYLFSEVSAGRFRAMKDSVTPDAWK